MTTDNFTEAAGDRADELWPHAPTGVPLPPAKRMDRRIGFRLGAQWGRDHALAQEPTDAEVERLAPAAVEHWRWSEKQRARHGDEGCVCTTCELFRALRTIRRDAKAEAWGEYAAALEAVPDYAPTEYDRGRVDQRHATIEELHARAARRDEEAR